MITCEHCGTKIDIIKDKRCPNCGASYAKNNDYLEYKRLEKERQENVNSFIKFVRKMFATNYIKKKIVNIFILAIFVFLFINFASRMN